MRLETKLKSTETSQLVPMLNVMLDHAHVRISWWGQRLVKVDGYEGTVTIDHFANEFLRATPSKRKDSPGLEERLNCYTLWDRVQGLYDQSEAQLKKTCLYRIFVPWLECPSHFSPCTEDDSPMAILGEWEETKEQVLFKFSPTEYASYFPHTSIYNHLNYATKQAVEEALKAKQS